MPPANNPLEYRERVHIRLSRDVAHVFDCERVGLLMLRSGLIILICHFLDVETFSRTLNLVVSSVCCGACLCLMIRPNQYSLGSYMLYFKTLKTVNRMTSRELFGELVSLGSKTHVPYRLLFRKKAVSEISYAKFHGALETTYCNEIKESLHNNNSLRKLTFHQQNRLTSLNFRTIISGLCSNNTLDTLEYIHGGVTRETPRHHSNKFDSDGIESTNSPPAHSNFVLEAISEQAATIKITNLRVQGLHICSSTTTKEGSTIIDQLSAAVENLPRLETCEVNITFVEQELDSTTGDVLGDVSSDNQNTVTAQFFRLGQSLLKTKTLRRLVLHFRKGRGCEMSSEFLPSAWADSFAKGLAAEQQHDQCVLEDLQLLGLQNSDTGMFAEHLETALKSMPTMSHFVLCVDTVSPKLLDSMCTVLKHPAMAMCQLCITYAEAWVVHYKHTVF